MKLTVAPLAACRIGDLDLIHCSVPVRAVGSTNVFLGTGTIENGKPGFRGWSRMGDINHPHLRPCPPECCIHVAPIAKGSSTVFVNGRGAGRVTDYVLSCTAVATGHPQVFVGG